MSDSVAERLTRDHRRLDDLFGRFLGAAHAGANDAAREAIADFDERLRIHTAFEEEHLLPAPPGRGLSPAEDETAEARLARELRLEHVQIRELSGMIRRATAEDGGLESARRLTPNLARRWDRHTAREENELARLEERLDPVAAAAMREAAERL